MRTLTSKTPSLEFGTPFSPPLDWAIQNHTLWFKTTQHLFPLSSQVGTNSNELSLQLLHQRLYGWFVISSLETRLMMAEKVKYY